MKFVEADARLVLESRKRHQERIDTVGFLNDFIASGLKFCHVIDDTRHYRSNSNMRSSIAKTIYERGFKETIQIFMVDGEVYLRRAKQ